MVPFGRTKAKQLAFVASIIETSQFEGRLSTIDSVVSPVPVLPPSSFRFLRALADRQAATLGELIRLAIPNRAVAVEKKFIELNNGYAVEKSRSKGTILAKLAEPLFDAWVGSLVDFAKRQIEAGYSCILIAPDYRDLGVLKTALQEQHITPIEFSGQQKASERYGQFLTSLLPGNQVVIGSRSAIYAPLQNLGGIAIFDDGDASLVEPSTPYHHVRDAALVRQSLENCDLLFVAHYRSVDVQRLVEMGFASESDNPTHKPKVIFSDDEGKLPALAWQQIKSALESDNPTVLIQGASKGQARSTYCRGCGSRAKCLTCNGPIWINAKGQAVCRWCSALNSAFRCVDCGSSELRQGAGGVTRTASELSKSFPGVKIVEATGDSVVRNLDSAKQIVIATPGAEPRIVGGYGRVVILDAATTLAKDSLKASEYAIRNWSKAIALMARNGVAVITGINQNLGQALVGWNLVELASTELANRRELKFPPHLRLASIQGETDLVAEISSKLADSHSEVLGPISLRGATAGIESRLVIKYPYHQGSELAHTLKSLVAVESAGSFGNSRSGRKRRAIQIRMDDPEVV